MLKTRAIFERKTDAFEPKDCTIEKTIRLGADEYDRFRKNMIADYDFISDNVDLMRCDRDNVYHCLLVIGEGRLDGVLIESEGSNYARYAAFMPNATDFLAAHMEQAQELQVKETQGINLSL